MTTSPHPPSNRRLRPPAATVAPLVAGLTPSALDRRELERSELGTMTTRTTTSRGVTSRLAVAIAFLVMLALLPTTAASAARPPGNGKPDSGQTSESTTGSTDTTATLSTTSTTTTSRSNDGSTASPTLLRDLVTQIGADKMWAAGYTGDGVDIALIDTGVAPVPELSASDIVIGPDLSFEGGIDEVAGLDTYGHGTHLAGIINGRTPGADPLNPRAGDFIGVAPDARLISVKVGDNTGAVDVSQVIAAIDWVVQNRNANGMNIGVLNLSYNTSSTQDPMIDPLSKAIDNAWDHGIVVVVSAGNEGRNQQQLASPARNDRVIAVSTAKKDGWWFIPNWAPMDAKRNPTIVAPGGSIASLRNPGSRIDIEHPDGRVAGDERLFLGSGTSQAAAVISGAAALILDQHPGLTPDQVKYMLISTASDIGYPSKLQGYGVINLRAALGARPVNAFQVGATARGTGSLEAARGSDHVTIGGELLTGEVTVTGAAWDAKAWLDASTSASAWSGEDTWSGSSWSGSSWSGSSWSGSSWSGSSWSGSSWSGSSWSGSSWSGSSWSGSSWSGSSWSGSSWSGSSWSGSSWSGSSWS